VPSASQGKKITKSLEHETDKQKHKKRANDASRATPDSSQASDAGRNVIMPKGIGLNSLLPSILSSLKSQYICTLLSALYASEEPFDDFVKTSSSFLVISRKAFKSVWPDLKIKIEADDVLFNIVRLFIAW
jgi:hypothetical protein